MKVIREEISGANKTRVVMALGRKEMEIVLGLLKKYKSVSPVGDDWKPEMRRVTNMLNEIKAGLELYRKDES